MAENINAIKVGQNKMGNGKFQKPNLKFGVWKKKEHYEITQKYLFFGKLVIIIFDGLLLIIDYIGRWRYL